MSPTFYPLPKQTLGVWDNVKDSVTMCECDEWFVRRGRQTFCSHACRQAAYRRSPSHAKCLAGLRQQRLNRRNDWVKQRMRDKSFIENFAHLSGPEPTIKVRLGMLNLKSYPKERIA